MFQQQLRIVRYETHKAIFECKLKEGKLVATHVFKMIGYFEAIERLVFTYSQKLANNIILHSLRGGFNQFRLNFNMNGVSKTLTKLHWKLMTTEQNIPISHKKDVFMVRKGKDLRRTRLAKQSKIKANRLFLEMETRQRPCQRWRPKPNASIVTG